MNLNGTQNFKRSVNDVLCLTFTHQGVAGNKKMSMPLGRINKLKKKKSPPMHNGLVSDSI